MQTNVQEWKAHQWGLTREDVLQKSTRNVLGGGCTRDLDVGDGVTGVHICQRSSNYISNRCSLPYIEYTLVKLKILS